MKPKGGKREGAGRKSGIISIDGMNPIRYAETYDICLDGSIKKQGKKRGRKSKQSIDA